MPLSEKDCAEIRSVLLGKATEYRYSEVARWARRAGFEPPRNPEGSHRVWTNATGRRIPLVEKGHGGLLPPYVKNAARVLLEVGACP